jgi:hypothetical protein
MSLIRFRYIAHYLTALSSNRLADSFTASCSSV